METLNYSETSTYFYQAASCQAQKIVLFVGIVVTGSIWKGCGRNDDGMIAVASWRDWGEPRFWGGGGTALIIVVNGTSKVDEKRFGICRNLRRKLKRQ
jgi:hypothetical protein